MGSSYSHVWVGDSGHILIIATSSTLKKVTENAALSRTRDKTLFSGGCFRMLFQVPFHGRTNGNDFQLMEMRIIQRSANQLGTQTVSPRCFRDFGMDQADAVRRAPVSQDGFLIPQRDFKLALCLVMRDRIAVHETFSTLRFLSKFYANAAQGDTALLFPSFFLTAPLAADA